MLHTIPLTKVITPLAGKYSFLGANFHQRHLYFGFGGPGVAALFGSCKKNQLSKGSLSLMTMSGVKEVRRELAGLLPRLWRFALYLTRDNAAAEDLVQATCLRALEKASQYAADTKLDSWVFTIMTSIRKNTLRSASKFKTDAACETDMIPFDGADIAELNIFAQQVLQEVAKLPDGQRAVVALVCAEGWSYKEVANTLNIPIGTVMSRLANARKALIHLKGDIADENAKGTEEP